MRKTMNQRNGKKFVVSLVLLSSLIIVLSLVGCDKAVETNADIPDNLLPGFQELMETTDDIVHEHDSTYDAVLPVKIYFDNTGSMGGFTINREGKREPELSYVKLIRCLRDMGRMQEAKYYILGEAQQDWIEYEESLYDNFCKEEFYVWWAPNQPGPLSKLCMDDGLDTECINIIFTELAEQKLNNTKLAEQIRKMCEKNRCEVDLYAFKFDFNGLTQVPDPNAASKMLESNVNDERPYYMIVTGPSDYMSGYRKGLRESLENEGLKEEEDYFMATSRISEDYNTITLSDVVFESFASFEEIYQEWDEEKKKNSKEVIDEEEVAANIREKSKNLLQFESTEQIVEDGAETQFAAFYYQMVDGIKKDYDSWRLNFYVPLNDWGDSQTAFTYEYHIYGLESVENGMEQEQGEKDSLKSWVEDTDSRIEMNIEICENFEGDDEVYPAVLYVSCKDKEVKKGHEPRRHEQLILLKVTKEKVSAYEKPEWMTEFDTGNTDEYFVRTFNLNGFYDVLFGGRNRLEEDGMLHDRINYVQIPILLTNLND